MNRRVVVLLAGGLLVPACGGTADPVIAPSPVTVTPVSVTPVTVTPSTIPSTVAPPPTAAASTEMSHFVIECPGGGSHSVYFEGTLPPGTLPELSDEERAILCGQPVSDG